MTDEKDLLGFDQLTCVIGWEFNVVDDEIVSCKGNDVCSKLKNTHQPFKTRFFFPRLRR